MRIDCESCGAAYAIDDKLIGDRGVRAQCPRCGTQKVVKPGAPAAPPAGAPPPAAATAPRENDPFAETTGPGAPFGAPATRAPTAAATPAANPFAAPPAGSPFRGPAAPPAPPAPTLPFGAPPGPAAAPGATPFGSPFAPSPTGSFLGGAPAAPPPPAAPAANPFAAPPAGSPFGAPPPPAAAASSPFGAPPAPAANPFSVLPPPAASPFGAPPGPGSPAPVSPLFSPGQGSPFGAPPGGSPFGSPPGGASADPLGGLGGRPGAAPVAPSAPPRPAASPFDAPPPSGASGALNLGGLGAKPAPAAPAPARSPFGPPGGGDDSGEMGAPPSSPIPDSGAGTPSLGTAAKEGHDWRIRLGDGSTVGPMSLDEVRARIKSGDVTREAQVAIGGGSFRPITAVGQLAAMLRAPGETKGQKVAYRKGAGGGGAKWLVLGAVVLAGAGGGVYVMRDSLFKSNQVQIDNILARKTKDWRMQYPDLDGTSDDHLARGLKAYRDDTMMGYRLADEELHKALILDPENLEAIGAYAENLALLPPHKGDAEALRDAMEGVEYAIKRAPRRPRLYRAQGALLWRQGSIDAAQAALAQALRLEAQDAQSKLWMAQTNLERNIAESIKLAEEAIQLDPELKRGALVLGQAYQKNGRFKTALNQLRTRLAKDKDHTATLVALAKLFVDVGDFTQAQQHLERVAQLEPRNVPARLQLAKVLYQGLRDYKRAADELAGLAEIVAAEPGDVTRDVFSHYAFVLSVRGRWREAEEAVNRALKDDPNYAPALYVSGRVLKQRGATAEAREKLEKALRGVSGSYLEPPVRTLLADTLREQGQPQEALRNYSHTIQQDPRYIRAHLGLAALHAETGNMQHAATAMREVLNIDPFYAQDHFFFTDYPELPEDLQAYRTPWAKLKADENDRTLVLSSEGITAFHGGQLDDAQRLLAKALKDDVNNLGAAMYLGAVNLARRDGKAAQKSLEQAEGINKLHVRTQYLLGRVYQLTGTLDKAEQKYRDVREADPNAVAALNAMGELLLKQGQEERARDLFLEAYRSDNDFTPAKANLLRANY